MSPKFATQNLTIPHRFEPRSYQLPLLEAVDSGRYLRFFTNWHRRSGKDKVWWNILAKRAIKIVGQHFYFLPTYAQGEKVIWEGIDNDGMRFIDHFPEQIVKRMDNGAMKLELLNGSIVQIVGTDKFDSIRGTNPKTAIFSEYAFQDPRAWGVISPILKLNGGLAGFNTTPNGDNHAKELYDMAEKSPDWWVQTLTIGDTGLLTEADMDRERAEGHSEEHIQQEYYCSWVSALVGAYYGSRMRDLEASGHIGDVLWDSTRNVTTFWDLGVDDEMTIWFIQRAGFSYKIIDLYNNHGYGFDHYAAVIRERPYKYESHMIPHDGRQREMSRKTTEGLERFKTLDELLREPVVPLPRPQKFMDKIEAVRYILPKCYFDAEKCRIGITALKSYRQEYDTVMKKWKNEPLHDWSSHFADAFAYFALHERKRGTLGDVPESLLGGFENVQIAGGRSAGGVVR